MVIKVYDISTGCMLQYEKVQCWPMERLLDTPYVLLWSTGSGAAEYVCRQICRFPYMAETLADLQTFCNNCEMEKLIVGDGTSK